MSYRRKDLKSKVKPAYIIDDDDDINFFVVVVVIVELITTKTKQKIS